MNSIQSIWLGAIALAALAVSSPGLAAAPPAVVTNPDWLEQPSREDVSNHFPKVAEALGVSGRAVVTCKVDSYGKLEDCEHGFAQPPELGFGEAALAMSGLFRMKPKLIDGRPVEGGVVRIPIRFSLPKASTEPTASKATPQELAEARKLIAIIGPQVTAVLDAVVDREDLADPGVSAETVEAARTALRGALPTAKERLLAAAAEVYAERFDVAEMRAITAFLGTPAGKISLGREVASMEVFEGAILDGLLLVLSQARSEFCAARNCDATPSPAELRTLEASAATIVAPEWREAPSDDQVWDAFPAAAKVLGVSGWAQLKCKVDPMGLLAGCAMLMERPVGQGFGDAAMSLAPRFRLTPPLMVQGAAGETANLFVPFIASERPNPIAGATPKAPSELARRLAAEDGFTARELGQATLLGILAADTMTPSPADVASEAEGALTRAFEAWLPTLLDVLAVTYDRVFTPEQLAEVLAFRRSAAGRAWVEKEPGADEALEPWLEAIADTMTVEARKAFCTNRRCEIETSR
ncbi:MAG: hypothetical protein C0481_05985 [Phenylobacterium sp.]|uniref:TonB family protein n=1 Tax=Phenylobacterium sp. TaxID=1871053 RepID=UPI0025ECFB56|nr:TonB family protein [Phenylobacterium sp.]MBA4011399.1 hypothetical protein [Phenylobacterium sp.]